MKNVEESLEGVEGAPDAFKVTDESLHEIKIL
jgi:hypothetical protein